jgi:multidrug transporter EmrE-like cation transporter
MRSSKICAIYIMYKRIGTILALITLIVISESTAQYHIKKSKTTNNWMYLLVAVLCYMVICGLLHKCYDYDDMGMTNLIWSVLSIITIMIIGHIAFKERINKYDMLGILFCIIGLYLIFIYGHTS